MKSPFKFLDAFTKEDRDIFFGREREIEELYHRVFDSRIMLVYGESGTGKSSLIQCGLANKFRDSDWLPVMIRRGDNLPDSISRAVKAAAITPIEYELLTTAMFKKAIRSLYIDYYKPIFFIFDQFEELFIFGSKEEKQSLVNLVQALVDSDIECRFIFIMREEYLANVTEFEKNVHGFLSNRVRIERMPNENAVMAIKGPCSVYDIDMEDGFPEKLLKKLTPDSPYVELTYLQVFLDKIYNLALKKKEEEKTTLKFSADLLDKTGDVSDLLGSFLEEQISLMPDQDAALAVLKSFVSVKGTKRQLTAQEVKDNAYTLGKSIDETALVEMIQTFVHLRILRDKDQSGRYELRHDALASKIFEKISNIEKEILEIRQFIENAHYTWQKREVLLTEEDLKYIGPYRSRLYLSEELSLFIEKSEKALEGKRRMRRQMAIAIPSAVIVVLSIFTIWALIEKNKSDRNYIKARANYYRITAKEVAPNDPVLGLRLAEYAYSLDSTLDSKRTMYDIYRDYDFYKILVRSRGLLSSVNFSPDGKTILTGSNDNTASLWDLNGNLIRSFIGHKGENYTDAFRPNTGNYYKYGVVTASFSPDGEKIITASADNTAIIWDINGKMLRILKGHKSWVFSASFSPDGEKVLTGSFDNTAMLWDTLGNKIREFINPNSVVRFPVFSPDGKTIFIGGVQDGVPFETSSLWGLDGKLIREFHGHTSGVTGTAFSKDGKYILTGSNDKTALLWDINGNIIEKFLGHSLSTVWVTFSPDGDYVLTSSFDRSVRLWDIKGNLIREFKGHKNEVWGAIFSPDAKKILTSSWDRTLRLWDLQGHNIQLFKIPNEQWVNSVYFSPAKKYILIYGAIRTHKLWDLQGNLKLEVKLPDPDNLSISFSHDEKRLMIYTRRTGLRIWEIGSDREPLTIMENGITRARFTSDGNLFVWFNDKARIYDVSGKVLKEFKVPLLGVLSPDGNSVLSFALEENTAILYDLSGNIMQTFKGHENKINSGVFSPDGKRILTGSSDNNAILWDMDGNALQVFKGHEGQIGDVGFSPDGNTVLTVSRFDNSARLWNMDGFEIQRLKGYEGTIVSAAFTADGKNIITVHQNGVVNIWDIKTPLQEFQKHNEYEQLTIDQKLEYGIISYKDIIKTNDAESLFGAGAWYRQNDDITDKRTRVENADKSITLLEKSLSIHETAPTLLELYKAYSLKIYLAGNKGDLKKNRESIMLRILEIKDIPDIMDLAGSFYNSAKASLDTIDKIEKLTECVSLMEKIKDTPAFESRKVEVANCYRTLVAIYSAKHDHEKAIETLLKETESINSDEGHYARLVMEYVRAGQIDKAIPIVREHRDRSYLSGKFIDVFLAWLKNQNLSASEYERIVEELNK